MFRNYLSAALRHLLRHRTVGVINIAGMAIAFAAALLIGLYVRYERSYETQIPGHENIYRVSEAWWQPNGLQPMELSSHKVAALMPLEFPEIAHLARLVEQWHSVSTDDREFNEQVFEADPDFFQIVRLRAVAGNLEHALDEPRTVAISRSMARKYFGREDVIGRTLKFERHSPRRITAVFEDLPAASHFNFQIVITGRDGGALQYADKTGPDSPFTFQLSIYLALKPGAHVEQLRARVPGFIVKHFGKAAAPGIRLDIVPIADIHLMPDARGEWKPRGNPRALDALTLVGVIILIIAVINFVNLSTAHAAQRGVEVGVRKLAGARRRDLLLQFLGEGLMHVGVAMLLAMSLVELLLPAFCTLLDTKDGQVAPLITFPYWRQPALLGALAGGTLLVGLLASAYPAFVLSSLRPAAVLKGGAFAGAAGSRLRTLLVTVQFAMLIALIFATTVIYRQTHFVLSSALRINTSQVVIYNLNGEPDSEHGPGEAFIHAASQLPGVLDITRSQNAPTNNDNLQAYVQASGHPPIVVHVVPVDVNFFDFYHVPLLAGRSLTRELAFDHFELTTESRAINVVVNEAAARQLGFADAHDIVGQRIEPAMWGFTANGVQVPKPDPVTVVGVTGDFPIESMRRAIEPTIYFVYEPILTMVSIRVAGATLPETMDALVKAWKKHGQQRAQEGWLLDGYYRKLYADVILQQRTLALFAGCAIFLAALGLFGLSIHTVQRRTKEIGVRKVMGASTAQMLKLLLWSFSKPVLWGSLLAWPLAAWVMKRWLEGFAYRVDLGWMWLPAATEAALLIALLTVSLHSLGAARTPPARALRYE